MRRNLIQQSRNATKMVSVDPSMTPSVFLPPKVLKDAQIQKLNDLFTHPDSGKYEFSAKNSIADISLVDRELPEVIFIGRSNVGKSSLINAIFSKQKLVKTSSKPGHTATLNFFSLNDKHGMKRGMIVDAPGYGYGSHNNWGNLIMEYLRNRRNLKRVFVLLQCGFGIKLTDEILLDILKSGVCSSGCTFQAILTKSDKIPKQEVRDKKLLQMEQYLEAMGGPFYPQVLLSSYRHTQSIQQLRYAICEALHIVI